MMLSLLLFVAATWLVVGALVTVTQVGKPRPPLSGQIAAVTVLVTAAIVTLLIIAGVEVLPWMH